MRSWVIGDSFRAPLDILLRRGFTAAQVLVLGLTATAAGKARERELRTIVRDLPKEIELWAGGRRPARHASIVTSRALVFDDYAAYQQELIRIGGRVA
jgi:hypothetical protein